MSGRQHHVKVAFIRRVRICFVVIVLMSMATVFVSYGRNISIGLFQTSMNGTSEFINITGLYSDSVHGTLHNSNKHTHPGTTSRITTNRLNTTLSNKDEYNSTDNVQNEANLQNKMTGVTADTSTNKDTVRNDIDKAKLKQEAKTRYYAQKYRNRLLDRFRHGPAQSIDNGPRDNLGTDGGSRPTVRPEACTDCFKADFKVLLDGGDICRQGTEVELLMMITSTAANTAARDVIRKTWGNVCNNGSSRIQCVYVFGVDKQPDLNTALVKESQLHKDVIQFDFKDTYANLTYKTMMSFRWVADNCAQAKYLMKTDDDMFVNTDLLPLLLQEAPDSRFVGGFCWARSSPNRDRTSKWYASFEQYSQSSYPKMCSGTGYLMSNDVIFGVLEKAANIPFFYLEDVYVSLCLHKLGVDPVLLTGFSNMKTNFESCYFRHRVITSHEHSPEELESYWTRARECKLGRDPSSKVYIPKYY